MDPAARLAMIEVLDRPRCVHLGAQFMVALAIIASAGCREGVSPFMPLAIDRDTGSIRHLTLSTTADLNPSWSPGSDTVYYTAASFVDFPDLAYTILRIPLDTGPATRIAPDAQPRNSGLIMLPVLSPDRSSFAYVHIRFMMPPATCVNTLAIPACADSEPLIEEGTVRVRSINARASAGTDPGVAIPFQGVDPQRAAGGGFEYNQRAFPFQREFRTRGSLLFRPSWAPDGRRIVFSDGLNLRIWDTTQSASTTIPSSANGLSPAWNPASDRIAYSRFVRGDSVRITCSCLEPDAAIPVNHNRWTYTVVGKVLTVINADGTGLTSLDEGQDPAWSPDGNTLYYVRDNQVFRIPAVGGVPVAVPNTIGASAPSVSPDGKWLAFARRATLDSTDADIWVVRLGAQ